MKTPEIKITRKWSLGSVREACIKNDLYTCGDCEEYDHMLNWVGRLYPSTENIYFIAKNIVDHSKDQTISNVMFILEKDAINTFFEIDGEE